MMSRRVLTAVLVTAVIVLGGCASAAQPSSTTVAESALQWLPCGSIECAQIEVPVDYAFPDGPTVSLGVFRRLAVGVEKPQTVVVLPDRSYGDSARLIVERAPLTMGGDARNVTLLGIAPRGSADSPMPTGSEHMVSTVAVADDVDAVRRALSLRTVSVLAWGSGATSAAVLKMLNPKVVKTMVLDSPSDPGVSQTLLAAKQIESSEVAVVEAMKWCASHISCPMNANVAKELNKFKTNLRVGRIDGDVDYGTIARAGTAALAAGRPQDLFVAITEAIDGDSQRLIDLGGVAPAVASAYAPCADVSKKAARRIAEMYTANMNAKTRLIHIGAEALVYGFCKDLPDSSLTLGKIDADSEAYESDVLVLIARGDQVTPPFAARTMAERMGWTYESVYANRHLVVSIDSAATARALQFLMKS
jgi:pimeloyl-ACP methyl ester carboxylesterase